MFTCIRCEQSPACTSSQVTSCWDPARDTANLTTGCTVCQPCHHEGEREYTIRNRQIEASDVTFRHAVKCRFIATSRIKAKHFNVIYKASFDVTVAAEHFNVIDTAIVNVTVAAEYITQLDALIKLESWRRWCFEFTVKATIHLSWQHSQHDVHRQLLTRWLDDVIPSFPV